MSVSKHQKYENLIARCKTLEPTPCAVVHPCDESSLRGAMEVAKRGLLKPILVGPKARIEAVAAQFGIDIAGCELVDAPHSVASAETAVRLAREGKVEMLMKGSLHTDELMAAVVKGGTGLRTARRISYCFIMDVPAIDRVVVNTDAAVNIFPTLQDKVHIVQNAIDLGAARIKKITSAVAGQADILVVPDLEAGNMLAKSLSFMADDDAAGIVLGARGPIILTSRADSVPTRLASCAVAALFARAQREEPKQVLV